MAHDSFTFKQFTIHQAHCAMKVGTDGTLLGAWACGGKRILDVGTGTGLIAIMMAQRFENSRVDAIDLDEEACREAQLNCERSPFADRLRVICTPVQEFRCDESACYDAIVCNPPFFDHSLKSPNHRRTLARHTEALPFGELCCHAARLLKSSGRLSLIIPSDHSAKLLTEASLYGFVLSRHYAVKTTLAKSAKRHLMEFQHLQSTHCEEREVWLQESDGARSEWYAHLTQDFYL